MLYSLQAARAIAALLVVLLHASVTISNQKYFGAAGAPLEHAFWLAGDAGVAFFFVLSGFIIHHVHEKDIGRPGTLLRYLRKRAVRIYPTYWIIFLAVWAVASTVPSMRAQTPPDLATFIRSLLLIPQDPRVVGGTGAPVIVVAWTLQYELVFYALFALALVHRWLIWGAVALLVVNAALEPWAGPYVFPRSFFASHLLLLFGLGVLTSYAVKRARWGGASPGPALACVGALVAIAGVTMLDRPGYHKAVFDLTFGLVCAGLIASLAGLTRPPPSRRWAALFGVGGDASYVLYLLHYPVVAALTRATLVLPREPWGATTGFVIVVAGAVGCALAFHLLIEKGMLAALAPARGRAPRALPHPRSG